MIEAVADDLGYLPYRSKIEALAGYGLSASDIARVTPAAVSGRQRAYGQCSLTRNRVIRYASENLSRRAQVERRLAAILAADVAGYSRMMEVDEADTFSRLKAHLSELVNPAIASHRGHIVKTTGDGLLAEFSSVVEAVACAVEIQRAMTGRNADQPEERRIRFRIGINLGDIIIEDGDIFGDGVNVAARLEGLAEPGGICVHRDVRSQVRNQPGLFFKDMGEVEVKNIARPLRVYSVTLDGTKPLVPAARTAIKRRRSAAALLLLAIVTILFGGGVVLWSGWIALPVTSPSGPATPPDVDKPSIAVLPFANLSAEPEQQYFADGLTEDLTTRLSSISGLFVIAHSSAHRYFGKAAKPQDIGRELGVRYLLEGSVRKSGTRLRINANLVEAESARQVWADQYDRGISDIFTLQDDVIGHIVSALAVELTDVEQEQIARAPTANLEAYDYYLRAETEGYYKVDTETLGRALAFYSSAIELDPNFADAHAGYARAAVEVWRLGYDQVMPSPLARKRAYDAAGKALTLDSNNARAYTVLAILQLSDGRHEEAIQSAERAKAINANAEVYANLGVVLSYSGRADAAVAATEQARRLNPAAPSGLRLLAGIVFYNARQYNRAIAELEPVAKAWPDTETVHEFLAAAYAMVGQMNRARQEVRALPDWPSINLTDLRRFYKDSYKIDADLKHFVNGIAAAGIPEWPFGFVGRPEDRVTAGELEALVLGRTWTGQTRVLRDKDAQFILQIDDQGRVAYSGAKTFLTGEARIENDRLCMRFESSVRGQWLCGDVFRNTTAKAVEVRYPQDYVYLLSDAVRYFSLASR